PARRLLRRPGQDAWRGASLRLHPPPQRGPFRRGLRSPSPLVVLPGSVPHRSPAGQSLSSGRRVFSSGGPGAAPPPPPPLDLDRSSAPLLHPFGEQASHLRPSGPPGRGAALRLDARRPEQNGAEPSGPAALRRR